MYPAFYRWSLRALELGRWRLTLAHPRGVCVALEVFDGGGYVPSYAAWRVAGRVVSLVEAGRA